MQSPIPQPSQPQYKKIDNYIYKFTDILGQGNFSKVYRGVNEITSRSEITLDETVAIKVIELNSLKSKKLEELLFSEIDVLKKLNHPNILKCYEVFTSNRNCYIITEICNGGDLESKLKKNKFFTEPECQNYILDVFKGLKYLAENNVIHRDLKMANIFLHNGITKIADFGFAKFTRENFKDINIGSPIYMSPEGFIDNIYGPKTDVWAFGIFMYELIHGKTPFSQCTNENDLRREIRTPISYSSLKNDLSYEMKEVIIKCLDVNEQRRVTIMELGETPYFQNLMKFDGKSLGGRKNNILAISSGQFSTKAMTPNHNSGTLPLSRNGGDQSFCYSLEKNKIELNNKVFSNTFQNLRNQDLSPQQNYSPIPKSNLLSPVPVPVRNSYQNIRPNSNTSPNEKFNIGFSHNRSANNFAFSNGQNNSELRSVNSPLSTSFKNIGRPLNREIHSEIVKPRAESFYDNRSGQELTETGMRECLPGLLSFKESVNCLHYCRLIYKYLLSVKDVEERDQVILSLAGLMFKILEEIGEKVDKKEVAYDHETSKKESKLREVSREYLRKYSLEFKREVPREVRYLEILVILKEKLARYERLYLKDSSCLKQMYFILAIVEATELLKKCAGMGKYWEWSEYKSVEELLAVGKDKVSYEGYLERKRAVVGI